MLLLPLLYGRDDWGLPKVRQNKDFFILYFRNKDFSSVVWLSTLCSHPPPSLKTKKGENPRVFLLVPLNLWGWRPPEREIGVLETQTARQGPSITWAQSLDTQKMPLCWGIADSRLSGVSGWEIPTRSVSGVSTGQRVKAVRRGRRQWQPGAHQKPTRGPQSANIG